MEGTPQHPDSLPPMSADTLPKTLPPRPRSRRRIWIISTTIVQGAGLFAGALTYWLLFDPVLGDYRLFGSLLAGCTLLTCLASLVVNVLLYQEITRRKP